MKYNGIIENKLRIIEEKVDVEIIFNIKTNKLNLFTQFVDEIRKS